MNFVKEASRVNTDIRPEGCQAGIVANRITETLPQPDGRTLEGKETVVVNAVCGERAFSFTSQAGLFDAMGDVGTLATAMCIGCPNGRETFGEAMCKAFGA